MNYTTEDAINFQNAVRADLERFGPDTVHASITRVDPELLALTLVLSTLSR